jgi:hypothetical protein
VTARISSPSLGAATYQPKGTWSAAVSHRWQNSDRHFVGDNEQEVRQKENSEVINNIHVVDLSVSYALTKRVTATLAIPFQFATRRGSVRDPNVQNEFGRDKVIDHYYTEANGLSDIKLLGTVWVLDPERSRKGNISLGLGVKFPTGEKDAQDEIKVFDTDEDGNYSPRSETRNVDNSIQPGDGAWGIIFDIYMFREIVENLNVFAAATYISEPETDAGVISGNLQTSEEVWSVADTYLFRAGAGYTFLPRYGLTLTLGARMEGTPVEDIFGSSEGRRRPGYAISIEPGIVFAKNGWFASFSAPVALYRNRERSVEDLKEDPVGHGDAAFADFMTLLTVGRAF